MQVVISSFPGGRRMTVSHDGTRHFLLASDFDQTLSFHDSGRVLAEMLGVRRLRREGRGPGAHQPGAAGRRAGLSDSARPGVPQRAARAAVRGGPARASAAQHPDARGLPGQGHPRVPVLVLRPVGGAARDRPRGARGHRRAGPHHRHRVRVGPGVRRGAVHRARAGRLRQGGGARGSGDRGWTCIPIGPSTSATAARTCT